MAQVSQDPEYVALWSLGTKKSFFSLVVSPEEMGENEWLIRHGTESLVSRYTLVVPACRVV